MLDLIVKENWFKAQATIGFLAGQCGRRRHRRLQRRYPQQADCHLPHAAPATGKCEGRFNAALSIVDRASFVESARLHRRVRQPPRGIGEDVVADRFRNAHDDYSILCKALADRLAEAFAERMHARVRREFWGYTPDEALSSEDLILNNPAFAPRPAIPRNPITPRRRRCLRFSTRGKHRRREADGKLCDVAGLVGVGALFRQRTESFYFGVGKIERYQVEDLRRAQGLERRPSRARPAWSTTSRRRTVCWGSQRERGDAATGAGVRRACQRHCVQQFGPASPRLQLRGASGLAKEGGAGVATSPHCKSAPCFSSSLRTQ